MIRKNVELGEITEAVIAILAGLVSYGSIKGVTVKYICRYIKVKVLKELKFILDCDICVESV